MYQAGDLIVYGNTGVCRVEQVTTSKSHGSLQGMDEERLYYVLRPLFQSETIYSPVDNQKVFSRPVISCEEANRLIDRIPSLQAKAYHTRNLQELREHYQAASQTFDCMDLIGLTMSIYAKKQDVEQQKKKFGQVDEQYMKRAEDMLYGEFSVALGIPKEEVPEYIASRVEALRKEATEDEAVLEEPCK